MITNRGVRYVPTAPRRGVELTATDRVAVARACERYAKMLNARAAAAAKAAAARVLLPRRDRRPVN